METENNCTVWNPKNKLDGQVCELVFGPKTAWWQQSRERCIITQKKQAARFFIFRPCSCHSYLHTLENIELKFVSDSFTFSKEFPTNNAFRIIKINENCLVLRLLELKLHCYRYWWVGWCLLGTLALSWWVTLRTRCSITSYYQIQKNFHPPSCFNV